MSRSTITAASVLFAAFACFTLGGCTSEEESEEGVPAEYAFVASEVEDGEAANGEDETIVVPAERYTLPPSLQRQKETQGPFPQPWTPPDK